MKKLTRNTDLLILAICLFFYSSHTTNSMSYQGDYSNQNSDEERFYIDETNWQMEQSLPDHESLSSHEIRHVDKNSEKSYENVTVKVGRKAVLPCFVNDLGSFKVIWAKNGDILSLGTTKINSDNRLNIQHQYISEWHLTIENVVTDDEGKYICKTNGDFYKIVNLQVLMPPVIDDEISVPAGTINLKEGSSLALKCFAEGKPEPTVRWYRWKKYKDLESNKEELAHTGNEIMIAKLDRNDPNRYECIATNSVPPATSRIFNIEIHFLPIVELKSLNKNDLADSEFSLECSIVGNPLERVAWYRNTQLLSDQFNFKKIFADKNYHIERKDTSSLNEFYLTSLLLTVKNVRKSDLGDYECCAMNAYGQVCSNTKISKENFKSTTEVTKKATTTKSIFTLFWNGEETEKTELSYKNSKVYSALTSTSTKSTKQLRNTSKLQFEKEKILDNSSLEDSTLYLNNKQFLHSGDSNNSIKSSSCSLLIYSNLSLMMLHLMRML